MVEERIFYEPPKAVGRCVLALQVSDICEGQSPLAVLTLAFRTVELQAYISPRSPYPISSVIGDSIDSSGQSIDGNNNHETVVNNDSSYDDRCGEALEKRCMSPEAEIGLIPQYGRSRDWSHDQSSPTISRFPSDERGRGRSRERLVSRKKFDSPDMQTSRQVMVGASKQGKEIGHKEGEGQGVKDTARVITRRRPSPKRLAAPCPPSPRSCPSPAPKPVSTSDVRPADVEGWLLDQLRGRPVWCVLSDLLFCVFERPDAETSKQVLVLPGCTVRVLEFKSAHLHLDKRRLLHGARLDSTASSSSAASYCTVINGKDDNNNKHSKDLSMCNGNVVATDDEVKSKGSGNGFSPKPLDGPSSSNAGSISSTSSYQSVTDGRTRGGSTGSVGSSSSSSSNIPNTLGLGNSKTVSGVDRFQFVLENSVTRQKHMFAVASRVELDLWTNALYKACSLDIASKVSGISNQNVHQEEQGKNCTHRKGRSVGVEDIILSDRSETSPLNGIATNGTSPRWKVKPVEDSISPNYTPRQTLPSRIDVHSLSLSLTSPHDVSKETVDEIRRKLKKDNQHVDGVELKPTPLKATHQLDESNAESTVVDASKIKSTATSNNGESPRKGRQFFKGRSPLDVLLGRKKRSSSADDAYNRNRKLFPVYKRSEDSLSNPSFSPRQAGSTSSQQSLESSQSSHSHHGVHTHDSSFSNSSVDSRDSPRKKQSVSRSSKHRGGGPLARSWDPDMKTSRGFGASIRRTASDLKERVFGGSNTLLSSTKTSENPNSGSKPPGLKFKDLTDARVKGYLQYRVAFKFVKVFCVLSKGCFYAFKSGKHEEVPLLAMVLSPCTVTYVVESELVLHRKKSKQKQRIFAFKLSQPHCKSIYACADDHQTLMQWVMAIQGEACRVQVDEELAAEIREKPSSLKKKQEKGLSGQASLQEHNLEPSSLSKKHQVNQLEHRFSCPSFDGAELGLDKSSQALSFREETLNGLITPRRGAGLSSINPQQAQGRGKGERSGESASIALHRSKSDKDIDLIFHSIKINKEKSQKDEDCDKVVNDKSAQCKTHGGIGLENKTSFRPSRDVRDIISAYQTHHSPYSVYQLNKKVDNSSNRTDIDPSSIDNIRPPTQHHLRLDLSGLADDNDILDMDTSSTDVANSSQGAPQSYSYRGEDNYHTGQAEETFRSATSPEKFPWKPNVKRTSSLNNTPATSVTRSSLSRSSLLPSKSGVSAGIDGKSSSPPTSHKKQTQSSKLTSFFSTSDFDAEQGYSSYSNFPGLKETRNQESRYTINRALGFDSEDFNPGGDIISPPPLFRCSEPGSTNLTLTQTPQDQQAAPGGTSSPQVPPPADSGRREAAPLALPAGHTASSERGVVT